MRLIRPFVLAACVAMAGCGQDEAPPVAPPARPRGPIQVVKADDPVEISAQGDTAAARDSGAADGDDKTPRVSDDPRQIAEIRKLNEQQWEALYAGAFQELHGLGVLVSRYQKALERQKPRALADLKKILDPREKATDEYRSRAARTLIELGDPSGETFLLDAVRTGRGVRRAAALRELDDWGLRRKVDLAPPDRAALMLECLDDPDPEVVYAAASLCVARKIPGCEAKLVGLLKDGKSKDAERLTRELAEVAQGPEAVRIVRDELLRGPTPERDRWSEYTLRNLLASPDPKVSEPIRTAYLRRLLGNAGKARYDQGFVRSLAPVADRTTVPVLEDIFAHARDPVSRAYALEALARLEPEKTLDRALQLVRVEGRFYPVIEALEKVASEQNADRIIDAFLEVHKRPGRGITMIETRFLMERLGLRGRKVIEERLDNLEPEAQRVGDMEAEGPEPGLRHRRPEGRRHHQDEPGGRSRGDAPGHGVERLDRGDGPVRPGRAIGRPRLRRRRDDVRHRVR